jgi:cytochrome c
MQKIQDLLKELNRSFRENAKPISCAIALVCLPILLANILYQEKDMIKRGYKIEISESGKRIIKEVKIVDLATVMKTADIDRGAKIFKKCASCHTIKKGDPARVGPNLWSVVGRKKGSFLGFSYSKAMLEKGGSWDIESINQFVTKPKDYLPGTKMAFGGLKKPQDRADVILYLQQQR